MKNHICADHAESLINVSNYSARGGTSERGRQTPTGRDKVGSDKYVRRSVHGPSSRRAGADFGFVSNRNSMMPQIFFLDFVDQLGDHPLASIKPLIKSRSNLDLSASPYLLIGFQGFSEAHRLRFRFYHIHQ